MEKIKLKAARVNAGYSQIEAAEKLGVTNITLGKYENGTQYPRIDVAYKMAKLYGVPLDSLDFSCGV